MKKGLFAILILSALFVSRCSTDFDLNSDFIERPFIMGLLNNNDSVHYIRINRVFLMDDTSALALAMDPSQIYYDTKLEASIEELDNGNVINTFNLTRVDGDSLGLPKETGVFSNMPNILYRFEAPLNQEHRYRLKVSHPDLDFELNAETDIVHDFVLSSPTENVLIAPSINLARSSFTLQWNNALKARQYELQMRFYFREVDKFDLTNVLLDTSVVWTIDTKIDAADPEDDDRINYKFDTQDFYNFLNFALEPDPAVIRKADSVRFEFWAGDEDLYSYLLFNQAQLGITSGQITSGYTNVEGDGLGIFASRLFRHTIKYNITDDTRDSIACGGISNDLGFAPHLSHPSYPFCQ